MKVTLYELEKEVGTLDLSKGKIVAQPEDSELLQSVLEEPIPDAFGTGFVSAEGDPEGFLRNLCYQYKSAYLYASQPDGEGDRPTGKKVEPPKVRSQAFRSHGVKHIGVMQIKEIQAGTCKQGERSDLTGCTPASGTPSARQPASQQQGTEQESKPQENQQPDKPKNDDWTEKPVVIPYKKKDPEIPKPLDDAFFNFFDELYKNDKEGWDAVKKYTGKGYKELNEQMRQCPPDFTCVKGEQKKLLAKLDEVFDKAPPLPEPVEVTRGISIEDMFAFESLMNAAKESMEKGDDFSMPSIISTSVDQTVGTNFGSSAEGVLFKIKAKSGMYVQAVSANPQEYELMISQKAKYKVVKVGDTDIVYTDKEGKEEHRKKQPTIFLEEVDPVAGEKPQPKPQEKPVEKPAEPTDGPAAKPAEAPKKKPSVEPLTIANPPVYVNEPIPLVYNYEPPDELVLQARNYLGTISDQEKKALRWYTGEGYDTLNENMRECPPDFTCVKGKKREGLDLIEKAIASAPPLPKGTVAFRGISVKDDVKAKIVESAKACIQDRKDFQMPSLTSTSVSAQSAANFGGGVIFRIQPKKGVYLESITKNGEEYEILMSAKAKYRVVSVQDADYTTPPTAWSPEIRQPKTTIFLEEIE